MPDGLESSKWRVLVAVGKNPAQAPVTVLAVRDDQKDWDWSWGTRFVHPKTQDRLEKAIRKCQRVCDVRNSEIEKEDALRRFVMSLPESKLQLPVGMMEDDRPKTMFVEPGQGVDDIRGELGEVI